MEDCVETDGSDSATSSVQPVDFGPDVLVFERLSIAANMLSVLSSYLYHGAIFGFDESRRLSLACSSGDRASSCLTVQGMSESFRLHAL